MAILNRKIFGSEPLPRMKVTDESAVVAGIPSAAVDVGGIQDNLVNDNLGESATSLDTDSVKRIDFPKDEIESLKSRIVQKKSIFTTRVSAEYNKYKENKIYDSNLGYHLQVTNITKLDSVDKHPFLEYLTAEQIKTLRSYGKMDLIELVEIYPKDLNKLNESVAETVDISNIFDKSILSDITLETMEIYIDKIKRSEEVDVFALYYILKYIDFDFTYTAIEGLDGRILKYREIIANYLMYRITDDFMDNFAKTMYFEYYKAIEHKHNRVTAIIDRIISQ